MEIKSRKILTLLLITLSLLSCKKINTEKISKNLYQDEGGNFQINFFNQTPHTSSKEISSEYGMITIYYFQLLVKNDNFKSSYVVSFNQYPSNIFEKVSKERLIDGNLSYGFKTRGFNKFDWSKEVEIPKGYGKRVGASQNGDYNIVYQSFLIDEKLYQIGLFKEKEPITEKEISAFFDTFVLIEK